MQFMEREPSIVGFMITSRKVQSYLCVPNSLKLSSVIFKLDTSEKRCPKHSATSVGLVTSVSPTFKEGVLAGVNFPASFHTLLQTTLDGVLELMPLI